MAQRGYARIIWVETHRLPFLGLGSGADLAGTRVLRVHAADVAEPRDLLAPLPLLRLLVVRVALTEVGVLAAPRLVQRGRAQREVHASTNCLSPRVHRTATGLRPKALS